MNDFHLEKNYSDSRKKKIILQLIKVIFPKIASTRSLKSQLFFITSFTLFSSLGTSVVASVESPSAAIKCLVLSRSLRIHLAILSAYFWRRNIILWVTSFGTLRFTKHRKRKKSHFQACDAVLKVLLLSMQQRSTDTFRFSPRSTSSSPCRTDHCTMNNLNIRNTRKLPANQKKINHSFIATDYRCENYNLHDNLKRQFAFQELNTR